MSISDNLFLRRVLPPMLAGVVALIAIVGFSLWLTYRTTDDSNEVVRARQMREVGTELLDLLQDMETGNRGYLLTHERRYLEPYHAAQPKVGDHVARLRAAVASDPKARELVERAAAAITDKTRLMAETNAMVAAGQVAAATLLSHLDRGKADMDVIRSSLQQLTDPAGERINRLLSGLQDNTTLLTWVSVSASLLIVLVAAAALWLAIQYTRELLEARQAVETANASLEARVAERTRDLSNANEEIQRYAYIVSHDLRAPLVNIVGFTGELEAGLKTIQTHLESPGDGPEAVDEGAVQTAVREDMPEAIGFIRASTTKMDNLISAILKLSREGRRQLRPERVDLQALIDNTVASVQHQLVEKDVEINIDGRLPVITSDRLALEQVFGNLIDNAVKYLMPGRPGRIRVGARERSGIVLVEVADNGRGIAATDHERIFELFRRAGGQTVAGEGIGLAHVRALVRRLGGEITVESEIGQGSRFKVRLPKYLAPTIDVKEA